ncbi:hypothetical protein [Cloacibacterium normanense]|uniref:hypothetical protein n=1 Tax=Cloacibacterium normanense TaxID=237258 RepID=UPI00352DEBA9
MKTKLYMFIMGVFSIILTFSQVGINTTEPHESSVLHLNSSDKGFLLPYFNITDLNLKSPVISPTIAEGLLAYNTNTTTGKGIYYWDGTKWSGLGQVNFTNIYNSVIKSLNAVLNDMDTFPYLINAMVAPPSPGLRRFDCDYSAPGDDIIINNPLSGAPNNFVIWDNVNKRINVPQQLLGYSITVNISLKYQQTTSNSEASRFVAYTGNAVVNTSTGNYTGGRKIKDLMFKKTKTSSFPYVRDELVLSPIVVTQEIIDHGIILYLGSGDNSPISFYEPVLTIDYGVVNITL